MQRGFVLPFSEEHGQSGFVQFVTVSGSVHSNGSLVTESCALRADMRRKPANFLMLH